MDPKKKIKIWIIIFLIALSAAGGLAVLLSKKSTLFKGSYVFQQNPVDLSGIADYTQPACSTYTAALCVLHLDRCHVAGFQCADGAQSITDLTPRLEVSSDSRFTRQTISQDTTGVVASFKFDNKTNSPLFLKKIQLTANNGRTPGDLISSSHIGDFVFVKGLSNVNTDNPNITNLPQSPTLTSLYGNITWDNNGNTLFVLSANTATYISLVAKVKPEAEINKIIRFVIFNASHAADLDIDPDQTISATSPVSGGTIGIIQGAQPAALPDLKAELTAWPASNDNIVAGTQVTFSTFSVKNIGTAAAHNFAVRFCIDNDQCASNTTGRLGSDSVYAAALQPNTSQIMSSEPWTAVAGAHKVVFCTDVTNIVVQELLNDNNCIAHAFTVTAAAEPPPPAAPAISIANPSGWTNSDEIQRAGDVDTTFGKFRLTAAGAVTTDPTAFTITKTGLLPDDRITSLRLIRSNGASLILNKTAANTWKGVGGAPLWLLANTPVDFELKGTIVRGDGPYDFTFSINQQPAVGGFNITSGVPFNLKHITVIGTEDLPQANKTEPANNSTVNTLTPTLRWNTNGIDGGSKPFHFRWEVDDVTGARAVTILRREFNWADGTPGNIAPQNFPRKCPANAIVPGVDNPWTCTELQIPPGVLQYNHSYQWFVHVNNGDKWTQWCYAGRPHPYCSSDTYFNFTTPPPPTVTVTASRPAGQNERIPAIANQTVKLATINIAQTGGDLMLTKLKRIVLEYQTANNPLEINKITDLHLFRGDSSEFTLGTTGKDLIILSKNSVNGTIEGVFQTVTPVSVIGDPRNQNITLYAKINGAAGDNGKKIKYVLKSVEFEPGDGNQMNLNIAVPEFTMHEDPPDAPQATFQTSPASVNRGQSSTLSWNITNATTITIDNGIGTVSGVGTRVVSPTTDTTYTLTASNAGGEVTRTAVVAVAQPSVAPPPPPPGGGTPTPQTCEQQGLKTYTGPPKPGERVTGMCIACTTEQYIANGGTCEAKKKKKVGNMDAGLPQAGGGQGAGAAGAAAAGGAAAGAIAQPPQGGQRGAAPDQTPNLRGSQRLVRAPERANTGPEALVYLGILGVVHAGLWLRRKMKERKK